MDKECRCGWRGGGGAGSADFSKVWLLLFSAVTLPVCCDCLPLPAFYQAATFNSDVSEWDVSSVTTLFASKCRMGGWIRNVDVVGGEGEVPGVLILARFGCCCSRQ